MAYALILLVKRGLAAALLGLAVINKCGLTPVLTEALKLK